MPPDPQRFTAEATLDGQGRTHVAVPFDPDQVWGAKPRHHVAGTIAGCRFRGVLDGRALVLGPAWRPAGLVGDQRVEVVVEPEGPQRADLAPDIAEALAAAPDAAAFFDSLAQFYRKGYLSWVEATKRRPEQRPERIAEMVRLLRAGHKQRPR
jgi:hypothetical protein